MASLKPRALEEIFVILAFVATLVFGAFTGLAYWGKTFASAQVKNQLVQEKIFFPAANSAGLLAEEFPTLQKYGGQQVDNGEKAKAYADEYIWVHMMKSSGNKTYAEISTEARANPTDTKLAGLKTTLFQGDMLRSSLLTAYAFSRFGMIAQYGVIACLVATVLMLGLTYMGMRHLMAKTRATKRRK